MGARVFLKSLASIFLALILFLNLMMFFDLTELAGGVAMDTTNKYFGFTSLLDFIKNFANNNELTQLFNFANRVVTDAHNNLIGKWVEFSKNGGVYDLISFFDAIGIFISNIFALLEYAFYPLLMVIYFIMLICFTVGAVMLFVTGLWNTTVPPNPYDVLNPVHLCLIATI